VPKIASAVLGGAHRRRRQRAPGALEARVERELARVDRGVQLDRK
jgi:hypothetical protein